MSATFLSKRTLAALEQVFAAEINGRMLQSKARIYPALAAQGYVEQVTDVLGAGTRFPVTVTGYVLTHAGRIAYCRQCGAEGDRP